MTATNLSPARNCANRKMVDREAGCPFRRQRRLEAQPAGQRGSAGKLAVQHSWAELCREHVCLVRPFKYDDEGFVIRHGRAVVPKNNLACLCGLTEDVRQRRALGEVDLESTFRLNRRAGERVLVRPAGVQANQFAGRRTLPWLFGEDTVMVGGFPESPATWRAAARNAV